jgi:hypothetical protein
MGFTPKCFDLKHKIRQPGNANRPIGKRQVRTMFLGGMSQGIFPQWI